MNKKFLYSPLSIKSIGENGVFSGYASVFNIVDKQNGKLTEKDTQEQTKAQGSSIISLKPASTKKSLNYSMKSTHTNS